MLLSEFDYHLPKELIAQYPLPEREKCRLMVLERAGRTIADKHFEDIVGYFGKGDLMILNDTKVMPARLFGKKRSGGKVEIFLIEKKDPVSEALVRPSARLKDGERITLESGDEVEVLGRGEVGRFVKFARPVEEVLKDAGHIPLPPYIARRDELSDRDTYQTIYGVKEGATASPTAGLHFTREILARLAVNGVRLAYVTLHTNYGTFAPVKTAEVEDHKMHREFFELPVDTIAAIRETKKSGGKVFAVGTTSTRVLESCAEAIRTTSDGRRTTNISGYTDMYIYPGYKFKVVDHLITNFHMPKSTLMILISAFAGLDFIKEAYARAIAEKYRFFSYGDAMLIL
ncbi:MAG: tRNA preQ1(34) S-adenosylmethionine ribosyltransferase-isomerase QueA [Candidatus Omnitrophica bacterium]|nr:tRNA preQ1(34) S-adenosylmethionine ribosyltransferase-isomerase QueA [Candidatus Omnitrophota bacterium]